MFEILKDSALHRTRRLVLGGSLILTQTGDGLPQLNAGVLKQNVGWNTSSTSEVSLETYTLKGGTLVAGRSLRFTVYGTVVGGTSGTVKIKIGSTVYTSLSGITAGSNYLLNANLAVSGNTSAQMVCCKGFGTSVAYERVTDPGTEDWTADQVVDLRALVVGAATIDVDAWVIELLGS